MNKLTVLVAAVAVVAVTACTPDQMNATIRQYAAMRTEQASTMHASVNIVDCTHVTYAGEGFPAGAHILTGYSELNNELVVAADGTFNGAAHRSIQEGSYKTSATMDIPGVYHYVLDIPLCGQ